MSMLSAIPVIGSIVDRILGTIDKTITDKDLAASLKHDIERTALQGQLDLAISGADIVKAEAQGQSWMQRNWRPSLMFLFIFILFNNYVLVPYANFFGGVVIHLPEMGNLWDTLNIGLGGYVVGRSGEKIATTFKK